MTVLFSLIFSDLDGLQKITVRNAYSSVVELPTYCYLKSEVKGR